VTEVPLTRWVLLDSFSQYDQVCCTRSILASVLVVVILSDWVIETDTVPLVSAKVGSWVSAGRMVLSVSWEEKAV